VFAPCLVFIGVTSWGKVFLPAGNGPPTQVLPSLQAAPVHLQKIRRPSARRTCHTPPLRPARRKTPHRHCGRREPGRGRKGGDSFRGRSWQWQGDRPGVSLWELPADTPGAAKKRLGQSAMAKGRSPAKKPNRRGWLGMVSLLLLPPAGLLRRFGRF